MKLTAMNAHPTSKTKEAKIKTVSVDLKKKSPLELKKSALKPRIHLHSSLSEKKKIKKLQTPSVFGSVGHALLQRVYIAGGWMQQGFEKVFTLTLFSKTGKKVNKEGQTVDLKPSAKAGSTAPRKYHKAKSKKIDHQLLKQNKKLGSHPTPKKEVRFLGRPA